MTPMSFGRSAVKHVGAFLALVLCQFGATTGSLVLAVALRGHIDAPASASSKAGDLLFGLFLLLCKPLSPYWLAGGTQTTAAVWMVANSAIWAVGLIVVFHAALACFGRHRRDGRSAVSGTHVP